MTADAFGTDKSGLARLLIKDNSLMTTVVARQLAASATHTQFLIELRIDDGITVQIVRFQELLQTLTYEVVELGDAALRHIASQAEYEVVDDAVSVLHHSGTHLYVVAPQLDELQGVAPHLDAANAAQLIF